MSHCTLSGRVSHCQTWPGFTIVHVTHPEFSKQARILDLDRPITAGTLLTVEGTWERHARYGVQFRARSQNQSRGWSVASLRRILEGPKFSGLGPVRVHALLTRFGADLATMLNRSSQDPGQCRIAIRALQEVSGIGPVLAQHMVELWSQTVSIPVDLYVDGLGWPLELLLETIQPTHQIFPPESAQLELALA